VSLRFDVSYQDGFIHININETFLQQSFRLLFHIVCSENLIVASMLPNKKPLGYLGSVAGWTIQDPSPAKEWGRWSKTWWESGSWSSSSIPPTSPAVSAPGRAGQQEEAQAQKETEEVHFS
jgi:hypothetical protein